MSANLLATLNRQDFTKALIEQLGLSLGEPINLDESATKSDMIDELSRHLARTSQSVFVCEEQATPQNLVLARKPDEGEYTEWVAEETPPEAEEGGPGGVWLHPADMEQPEHSESESDAPELPDVVRVKIPGLSERRSGQVLTRLQGELIGVSEFKAEITETAPGVYHVDTDDAIAAHDAAVRGLENWGFLNPRQYVTAYQG